MKLKYIATKVSLLLVLVVSAIGCDSTSIQEDDAPVFVIGAAGGETFRVKINDPVIAAEAERLLKEDVNKIVHGRLLEGDGGFNAPYKWHLDPDQITFPDFSIELCDGRPSYIEDDLDYWINNVKVFCPWGAKVVGVE